MSFSVSPLLLHSEPVPATARRALLAARQGPRHQRVAYLETAARILHRELDLDCADARELVGLPETSRPCAW
jgi:hypothetical protein